MRKIHAFGFLLACLLSCHFASAANTLEGFDLDALEKELSGPKGLLVLVHGVVPDRHQVVVGYRDPEDPMHAVEFPALGRTAAVKTALEKLQRNDRVRLFGEFKGLDTPVPHLDIARFEVLSKWDWGSMPSVKIPTTLADEIAKQPALVGKVHAVVAEGHVLLLDYRDQIFPVIVGDTKLSSTLWTNDKVRVRVTVQPYPSKPTHLVLDESKPDAVVPLQRMSDLKGKKATLKGVLVRYPQSALARESFAVQVTDEDGVREFYFLLGAKDDVNAKLREQISKTWKEHAQTAHRYRSREINEKILVEAIGAAENPQGAGNPQVYLPTMDALHLSVAP